MGTTLKLVLWALVKGAVLALIGLGIAQLVVGMGHGWTGHMPFAFASFLLCPLAFLRASVDARTTPWAVDAGATGMLLALFALIPVVMVAMLGMPDAGSINLSGFGMVAAGLGVVVLGYALLAKTHLSALWGDAVLVAVALCCDILLWHAATAGGNWTFRGGVFAWAWIGQWCIWQGILVAAIFRHLHQRSAKADVIEGSTYAA